MLNYFPIHIAKSLKNINFNNVYEIRIRQNKKIVIITSNGKTILNSSLKQNEIEEIVYNACKKSIYSFEEQIKRGYVTTKNGVRIGLAGEFVVENGKIITIKNFTSLCIRFPHEIIGVASKFVSTIYDDGSVLVISKSGVGKTTFIRDFSRLINERNSLNTIIIDERNEIVAINESGGFNVGNTVDVLTYTTKSYGFNQAVRTLNPDLIITDELMSEEDVNGVLTAILSGVKVVATIHAKNLNDALNKEFMKKINNMFDYYVLLEIIEGKRVSTIYDKNKEILCRY